MLCGVISGFSRPLPVLPNLSAQDPSSFSAGYTHAYSSKTIHKTLYLMHMPISAYFLFLLNLCNSPENWFLLSIFAQRGHWNSEKPVEITQWESQELDLEPCTLTFFKMIFSNVNISETWICKYILKVSKALIFNLKIF